MGELRGRALALATAALVIAAGLVTSSTANSSTPASAVAGPVQVLPQRYLSTPTKTVWPASASYAMGPTYLDKGLGHRNIWRVADGAVVRKVRVNGALDQAGLLAIRGDHAIWRGPAANGRRVITAENLRTGSRTGIRVPAADKILAAFAGWVVTSHRDDVEEYSVRVHRANGTNTKVHTNDRPASALDSDATAVILLGDFALPPHLLLDVTTGKVHEVPGTKLTPNRVFGLYPDELTWVSRSSPADVHTVEAQAGNELMTLGDEVVWLDRECADPGCTGELRPIDLATGVAGEPIVSDVHAAQSASDGALILKLSGGAGGRLAVLRPGDGQPRIVASLPLELARPLGVGLSGSRVIAGWEHAQEEWEGPMHRRLYEYVDGRWSGVNDPVSGEPYPAGRGSFGTSQQIAGNHLLVNVTPAQNPGDDEHSRIAWPGGARSVISYLQQVWLGRGGQLLGVALTDPPASTDVFAARSGKLLLRTQTRPSLDGAWAWVLQKGVLVGRDTARPGTVKRVRTRVSCKNHARLDDLRGRWALVGCAPTTDSSGIQYVVDLRGGLRPWRAPKAGWELGNGFLFKQTYLGAWGGPVRIRAIDFSPQHRTRVIDDSPIRAVVDDAGSRRLIYGDHFGRIVIRTLDWVGQPAKPDRTPPTLLRRSGTPRHVVAPRGKSVNFGWRYADRRGAGEESPGGVTGYQVRYRKTKTGGWSPWTKRSLPRNRPSLSVKTAAGRTICFQVRAVDLQRNWSSWSKQRCTTVKRRR